MINALNYSSSRSNITYAVKGGENGAQKIEESDKMVSSLIISESVTMVGSLSGGKAGKLVYDYIMDNCTVFNSEKSIYDEAIQTYLKYDGTLSLVDVVSLELMKMFNFQEIVSFDSDFDKVNGIIRIH